MDSEFDPAHFAAIRHATARIDVADVRAFGLTWEDCDQLPSNAHSRYMVEEQ